MIKENPHENKQTFFLHKQWKIVNKNKKYKRIFCFFNNAKRCYGQICQIIKIEKKGEVKMYSKLHNCKEWILIEKFTIG